jgi:hypothetical protein
MTRLVKELDVSFGYTSGGNSREASLELESGVSIASARPVRSSLAASIKIPWSHLPNGLIQQLRQAQSCQRHLPVHDGNLPLIIGVAQVASALDPG